MANKAIFEAMLTLETSPKEAVHNSPSVHHTHGVESKTGPAAPLCICLPKNGNTHTQLGEWECRFGPKHNLLNQITLKYLGHQGYKMWEIRLSFR